MLECQEEGQDADTRVHWESIDTFRETFVRFNGLHLPHSYLCAVTNAFLFFLHIFRNLMRRQWNLWRVVCPDLPRTVGKLLKVQQIVSILFMARGSVNKAGISRQEFLSQWIGQLHTPHEMEKMYAKNIFKSRTAGVLCESSTILTSSAWPWPQYNTYPGVTLYYAPESESH